MVSAYGSIVSNNAIKPATCRHVAVQVNAESIDAAVLARHVDDIWAGAVVYGGMFLLFLVILGVDIYLATLPP